MFDVRPLVYHSDRQALSTALYCSRAGQLATAVSGYLLSTLTTW